jgi:hypothetical protein
LRQMWSFWHSPETISLLAAIARWSGVIVAVSILVLGQRLATLQKAKQGPRKITAEQSKTFARATQAIPKGQVLVMTYTQDAEVSTYAQQIWNMLIDAKYDVDQHLPFGIGGTSPVGIVLRFVDEKNPPVHLSSLVTGFKSIDIDAKVLPKPDGHEKPEVVIVVVGNKEQ